MSSVDTRGRLKRTRRRIIVVSGVFVFAVGLATAGTVVFRHDIVHRVIENRAAGLGLAGADFRVDEVTTQAIVVSAFRAGDVLSFDRLAVGFTLAGLMAGRVGKVELAGLGADIGLLTKAGGASDDRKVPGLIDLTKLPEVTLRDARLTAAIQGGDAVATVNATLSKPADGALSIDLRGKVAAPAGEVSVTFHGTAVDAGSGMPIVTGRMTIAAPAFTASGLRLEAVDVAAPIKLTLGAREIGLTFHPKIVVRAQRVVAPGGIDAGPVSASIAGKGSIIMSADRRVRARLDAELKAARPRAGGLAAREARATLPLRIEWANGGATVDIMQGASVRADRVRLDSGAEIATLSATLGGKVTMGGSGGAKLTGAAPRLHHDLSVRVAPISVSGDRPIQIRPGPISITGGVSQAGLYRGRVSAVETRVTLGDRPFAISGLSLGFAPDGKTQRLAAELAIASLRDLSPVPLVAPMTMRVALRQIDGNLAYEARIGPSTSPEMIFVTGAHDPAGGTGHAELSTTGMSFLPGGLQPKTLAPGLETIHDVTGQVKVTARLDWDSKKINGRGRIDLTQLGGKTVDGGIDGMSGTVVLDSLFPPSTPPDQRLFIRRIDAGAALTDTRIRFALLRSGVLRIDSAAAALAGGRIGLVAPSVDLLSQTAHGALSVRGVWLEKLLPLFKLDDVAGTGRLYGSIPIRLANGKVSIARGGLTARGGGKLRIKSKRAARILQGGGKQVALMLKALENFDYKQLSVEIDKSPAGAARVALRTLGRNPDVLDGRSFQINVNLQTNLDNLLQAASQWYQLSGRALGDIVNPSQR